VRVLAVTVLCAAALAVLAAPASATSIAFGSPSGSIHCIYSTAVGSVSRVRCDVDYDTRFRRRPAGCMGDYGRSFELTARGRGRAICVTDSTNVPGASVLRYGTSRRFGAITCTSRTTGLRCYNTRGHGFFLARNRQLVY
jgi:hypothetical protein